MICILKLSNLKGFYDCDLFFFEYIASGESVFMLEKHALASA